MTIFTMESNRNFPSALQYVSLFSLTCVSLCKCVKKCVGTLELEL